MTKSVGSSMRVIIDPTSLGPWSAFKSIPGGISAMVPVFILLMLMCEIHTLCLVRSIQIQLHGTEATKKDQNENIKSGTQPWSSYSSSWTRRLVPGTYHLIHDRLMVYESNRFRGLPSSIGHCKRHTLVHNFAAGSRFQICASFALIMRVDKLQIKGNDDIMFRVG